MNTTEGLLKRLPPVMEGVPGDFYPLVVTKMPDKKYWVGYWKYGSDVDYTKSTFLIAFNDPKINEALRGLSQWVKEKTRR